MLESGRTNSRFCGRSFWDWIFNHSPPQRPNSVPLPVQMLELTISRRGRNMHFLFLERLPRPTEVEHSLQLPHFVHSGRKRINFVVKKEGEKPIYRNSPFHTVFPLSLKFYCNLLHTFVSWSLFLNSWHPGTDCLGLSHKCSKSSTWSILVLHFKVFWKVSIWGTWCWTGVYVSGKK